MIEYIDLALSSFLANAITALNDPTHKVSWVFAWAPPQVSRQKLTHWAQELAKQNNPPSPTNTSGIPGMTLFRTQSRRLKEGYSQGMAKQGWQFGRYASGENEGDWCMVQTIPQKVTYTVSVWAKDQMQLNDAERLLSFLDVYQYVQFTCQSNTFKFPILYGGEPMYKQDIDEKTGNVIWYGLEKTIEINGVWAKSSVVPFIGEIQVIYKQMTNGEPVNPETLDNLNNLVTLDTNTITPPS